jgi:hypothetical protein
LAAPAIPLERPWSALIVLRMVVVMRGAMGRALVLETNGVLSACREHLRRPQP